MSIEPCQAARVVSGQLSDAPRWETSSQSEKSDSLTETKVVETLGAASGGVGMWRRAGQQNSASVPGDASQATGTEQGHHTTHETHPRLTTHADIKKTLSKETPADILEPISARGDSSTDVS
ncbi:hypothetical protein E2C01_031191 [Portunus trituberculatus]|uniref:Uncharacterized protein n=1 Tax=Portunus trituberculatus TaxID=210409 RepID=A0A5B7ETU9_PORTR|nr:hypothetical protein [Portunus trituberculatus]